MASAQPIDHQLILTAKAHANGANVHQVYTLCATYTLYCNLCNDNPTQELLKACDQLRDQLVAYIKTGKLEVPDEPTQ